ncbi:unnamed protein product [Schistosoma mattheei]|uniref:Uncharacterized protein n=1 Tax=Schistosoma mattheei TaxID=31246 RepID=A0A183PWV4_9TREM|nr:unnamed protein product [Schistosoma mattheei]
MNFCTLLDAKNKVGHHSKNFEVGSYPPEVPCYLLDLKLVYEVSHHRRKAMNQTILAKERHLSELNKRTL